MLYLPNLDHPNCLHTTLASLLVHCLLHIVPQVSSKQISTLPALSLLPTIRTSPSMQTTIFTEGNILLYAEL